MNKRVRERRKREKERNRKRENKRDKVPPFFVEEFEGLGEEEEGGVEEEGEREEVEGGVEEGVRKGEGSLLERGGDSSSSKEEH